MKTPLLLGFLALLALIGVNLVLTNRTIAELRATGKRVTDLQAARLELEATLRNYVDAETGERGFLLTGDEKFLTPYLDARKRLEDSSRRLKAMLGDDRELAAIRGELDALGEKKMALLEARIAERRRGDFESAVTGVQTNQAKLLMDQMRARAAAIDQRKSAEVTEMLVKAGHTQTKAAVLTTGAAIVVGVALVLLYFLTRTHLRDLERAREKVSELLAGERAAHSEAAQANRLKDEFLALVSHELRTPLNAILGWTSLLKEGAEDEKELREGLETIDRNARVQARLVNDLLDVSRIISGKVRLEIVEVNLRAVVTSVIDTLRPTAEMRGVKVLLESTTDPAEVLGDEDRLQQIAWNLLSNAIKFTPRGGEVTLRLSREESSVVLAVADSGAGIAPEFLPHIFKRFSQGDASTTRAHGGLGLGLAITRHLVELHGGKVSAHSEGEGKGATFRVEIPILAVKELRNRLNQNLGHHEESSALPDGSPEPRLDGCTVLAVDDQVDTLAVINRVLSRAGAEVRTAASAAEGLAILEGWQPNLVISDIGMPGQDGYSFIRTVRTRNPGGGRRLPALALTAFARDADRKLALEAGFDEHLAKPIDAASLVRKVAHALTRS